MKTYPFNLNDTFYLKIVNKINNVVENEYEVIVTKKDIPNDVISFNFTMMKNNHKVKTFPSSYKIGRVHSLINTYGLWKISFYNNVHNIFNEELFTL